jgi:hypothetical protein
MSISEKMDYKKVENLLTDTLSHINNAVTNIFTNIERDVLGDIEMINNWYATSKEKELVDTFNELVTLEQKIIDILHPMRHEDGKLPSPKYLYIERANCGFRMKEEQRDYEKSEHLYYAKRDLKEVQA